MKTFQLKNGTLQMEDDSLLIEGGRTRLLKWVSLLAAICWSLFFLYRGYLHYRYFSATNNSLQLAFLLLSLMALGFWVWVGGQSLSMSGKNRIPLDHITRAQKVYRPGNDVPLITLHLKNKRKHHLEFSHLDDLYFTDSLAGRGVPVTE